METRRFLATHTKPLGLAMLGTALIVCLTATANGSEESTRTNSNGTTAAELRAMGPDVMDGLMRQRLELVDAIRHVENESRRESLAAELANHQILVDEVGAAKYSYVSGLYWYTDWERASAEAKRTSKPILSLRLMGKLTDEYSCANSRFFRAALYSNQSVAEFLKQNFVLHWKSVRPVPKVTIDFGDGRKLCRTLTGNSIHYVLTPQGEVIDAVPGLYDPATFTQRLGSAMGCVRGLATLENNAAIPVQLLPEMKQRLVNNWHERELGRLAKRWEAQLTGLNLPDVEIPKATERKPVDAKDAIPLAITKSIVEFRLVGATLIAQLDDLEKLSDDEVWNALAEAHAAKVQLDERSMQFVTWHAEPTQLRDPSLMTLPSKRDQEKLNRFQLSIAKDTMRNEFRLHRKLHEWMLKSDDLLMVDTLNDRVYDELFLTPGNDPWIGLLPEDLYTGLVGEGVQTSTVDR